MTHSYTLDELIKIFYQNAEESRKHDERLLREFQKNYPDEPVPDHFRSSFNISEALATICEEILKLKCHSCEAHPSSCRVPRSSSRQLRADKRDCIDL